MWTNGKMQLTKNYENLYRNNVYENCGKQKYSQKELNHSMLNEFFFFLLLRIMVYTKHD